MCGTEIRLIDQEAEAGDAFRTGQKMPRSGRTEPGTSLKQKRGAPTEWRGQWGRVYKR